MGQSASSSQSYSVSTSGSMRPDILNINQINGNKIPVAPNSLGNSPMTPKHTVPAFLEGRNQMKGSLFMNDEGSSKNKTEGSSYYTSLYT